MPNRCGVIAGMLLLAASASAAAQTIDLRAELCRDATQDTLRRIAPHWLKWTVSPRFVQLCPLYGPDGQHPWSLLTFRFADPGGDTSDSPGGYPDSEILDRHGVRLGSIDEPFPSGGLGIARIVAMDWRQGLPYRVEIQVFGAAASRDDVVPALVWNPARRRYDGGKHR